MGLDAAVYCNCFETGKLKELPPYPDLVFVDNSGNLSYIHDSLDVLMEIDRWAFNRACEHEDGVLLHHYIGNITRVANLYENLSTESEKFPIILKKILYSGTHCGDFLSSEEVKNLEKEIEHLKDLVFSDEASQDRVNYFRQQLEELTKTALEMGKPISF